MSRRRAVIFDMDGVLVLSGPAHWVAWRDVALANGVDLTREQFLGFNGLTNPDICRRLWGAAATPAFADRIAEAKEQTFRRTIADAVPLAPGCADLLRALQAIGAGIAVGSSAPAANVDLVLDGGGIRAFFQSVVHEGLVLRGKPAPDIFLRAAHELGLPPRACTVVEDAPSGIRAAVVAGMQVVGLLTNHAAEELRAAGAATVVPALQDLDAARLVGA